VCKTQVHLLKHTLSYFSFNLFANSFKYSSLQFKELFSLVSVPDSSTLDKGIPEPEATSFLKPEPDGMRNEDKKKCFGGAITSFSSLHITCLLTHQKSLHDDADVQSLALCGTIHVLYTSSFLLHLIGKRWAKE